MPPLPRALPSARTPLGRRRPGRPGGGDREPGGGRGGARPGGAPSRRRAGAAAGARCGLGGPLLVRHPHGLHPALRAAVLHAARGRRPVQQLRAPCFSDFAYLAFTLGMTFQVSDMNLETNRFRKLALGQTLLSYLFGTVILAATVNLIVSLG